MDIFGGSSQNWPSFSGSLYAVYGIFLRSMHRMWIFLGVAKI